MKQLKQNMNGNYQLHIFLDGKKSKYTKRFKTELRHIIKIYSLSHECLKMKDNKLETIHNDKTSLN